MGRKSEKLAILKYFFNNFRPEWHQDALSSEIDESFSTDFSISCKILRRNNFRTLNRKNHNIYAQAREECEEKLAEMIADIWKNNMDQEDWNIMMRFAIVIIVKVETD